MLKQNNCQTAFLAFHQLTRRVKSINFDKSLQLPNNAKTLEELLKQHNVSVQK